MKTVHQPNNNGENCSCTSCVYKSESDRPSFRNIVAQGSRIDHLYYGKYIPLREKKLLDRLVRTRAVYDDIRAQLISDSTVNLNTKANLKIRTKFSDKQLDTHKSSAVLKLVSMVDKGETLSSKNLSECCSCCSCSSRVHLFDDTLKKQRHKHGHHDVYGHQYYVTERGREAYKRKRGVRFKAKNIRSDPCTCTFKFSGLLKKQSNTMIRKLRSIKQSSSIDLQSTTEMETKPKRRGIATRTLYQNLKRSQERITESMLEGIKKLTESKTKLRDTLELHVKKSLEKLNQTKEKLRPKTKVHSQRNTYELTKAEFEAICACPELDLVPQTKKDSLRKIKGGIKKINESKARLIESLEIHVKKSLEKLKKTRDKLKTKTDKQNIEHGITCICPENDLISQIRKDSITKFKDDIRKKQMMKDWTCDPECIEDTCVPEECFNKLNKKRLLKTRDNVKYDQIKRKKIKQGRNIGAPIGSSSIKIQALPKTVAMPIETKKVKPKLRIQQTKVKSKTSSKRLQYEPRPLDIRESLQKENKKLSVLSCYCKNISNDVQPQKWLQPNKILKNEIDKTNLPYKSTERKQKPKSERKRHPRQAVRIGSSFSFNIEFYKDKKESFDKISPEYSQIKPSLPLKYKNYESKRQKKLHQRHRGSQRMLRQKLKDRQTGTQALNRCFCTLKLEGKKNKSNKSVSEEIPTTEGSVISFNASCTNRTCISKDNCSMTDCKMMRTTKKNKQEYLHNTKQLLQYECAPGVCIPNYCDPYQCIKLNNMRRAKIRKSSVKCGCPPSSSYSRKTKSTSSLTSKSYIFPKAKYVQSVVEYKRKPKNVRDLDKHSLNIRKEVISGAADGRQVVRIGSTFSFNIEFHKSKTLHSVPSNNLKNLATKPKKNLHLKQKLETKANQRNVKDIYKTTPTQILKRNRHYGFGRTLKRCFCTLKLQEKYIKPEKRKMLTTGTKTEENAFLDVMTFSRSTKIDRKNLKLLEPFECEPFVCTPGECNPYVCLEKIKKRLKDVSIITKQPVVTTGSSTVYSNVSVKTIQVDSKPKSKNEKKLYIKNKKRKKSLRKPYDYSDDFKQAVKLGSSFSFNVEFYKNKPSNYSNSDYLEDKKKKTFNNNTLDKKIKMNSLNVANVDTQVQKPKKHKASMVTPLLKRCFCTLNLQKKRKHQFNPYDFPPRIFTVNRAIVEDFRKRSCLKLNKPYKLNSYQLCIVSNNCKSRISNYLTIPTLNRSLIKNTGKACVKENLDSISLNPFRLNMADPLISKLSAENKTLECGHSTDRQFNEKQVSKTKSFISTRQNENQNTLLPVCENDIREVRISSLYLKYTPKTYFNRYITNRFCTMNLQIEKNNIKKPLKLFPYECEPGVCIPGECNPYECQKLILNRTIKKRTSKTGTGYKTESVSSQSTPKLKKNKKNLYLKETSKPRGSKNPYTGNTNNVVRIGSSFNFDIEFFKNAPIQCHKMFEKNSLARKHLSDSKLEKRTKKTLKNIGTKKLRDFHNIQSQSALRVITQKSYANLPMTNKCFCTLKLQKKGRLHKKYNVKNHKNLPVFHQSSMKVKTTSRGQNTKGIKPLKPTYHLEPYECEPNICNPGNCDPYQCLELMKRKRVQATGIHTVLKNKNSMASMNSENQSKVTQRNVKQNMNKLHPKITKRSNERPSKQVVRVGSNFSFSVEFFKDRSGTSPSYHLSKDFNDAIKSFENKLRKHKDDRSTQIRNFSQVASSMTSSLLKRCFCTEKLYQSNKGSVGLNLQKNASPSFFKRCLCWLNIKKPERVKSKDISRNKISNLNKKTTTQDYINLDKQMLDRFECEPGSCIPGECNPIECEAILRKKYVKRHSTASSTDHLKSRSTFTFNPKYTTKSAKTQSVLGKYIKKPVLVKTTGNNYEKQVVRIGSNFNFNIEFYKDKTPTYEKNISQQVVCKSRSIERSRGKGTGINKHAILTNSRLSQVLPHKKKDRGIGINKIVKRCFCTLQLHNKQKQKTGNNEVFKVKTKSIMTEKNKFTSHALLPYECEPKICIPYECDPYECDKIIKSRKHKGFQYGEYTHQKQRNLTLLPYECEPLSCIPGECNPVECLERIKKRQLKNFGTNIEHGKYTASTMTRNNHKSRHKTNQSKSSYFSSAVKTKNILNENSQKQAVKIGSKFSFDIEFYKDKGNNEDIRKETQKRAKILKVHEKSTYPRHIKSKEVAHQIQKKTNNAVVGSFLERCFCTFKLHKKKFKQKDDIKPLVSKKIKKDQMHQTALLQRNKVSISKKLQPFECEPNTCVPGFCDPYECEKRIKRRLLREFSQKTEDPIKASKFITTENIKTKSVKSQALKIRNERHQRNEKVQGYQEKADVKKQVCRIGSTFGFDVQFYKNQYSEGGKKRKFSHEKITANVANKLNRKSLHSQTKNFMKHSKSSTIAPILKRCFCTLKLQKLPTNVASSPKVCKFVLNKPKNLQTATQSAITGRGKNCECEKQTQIKQNTKFRDIKSQAVKHCPQKCVRAKAQKLKIDRKHSNLLQRNHPTLKQNVHEQEHEIVEVPRFGNPFNKQAVRIASNFSFNIEFYKKTASPIKFISSNTEHGISDEKNNKRPIRKIPHTRGSQVVAVTSRDKALGVEKALKRCFCTLKLQNINSTPRNIKSLRTSPHYPQVVEVRRVSIQHKPKMMSQQTNIPVQSVATRINNKYMEYCCNSKNSYQDCKGNNFDEMKTILPYRSTRFNKTPSKKLISQQIKQTSPKQKDIITKRGKRLTKKKSQRGINFKKLPNKNYPREKSATSNIKNIFCRCVHFFTTKQNNFNRFRTGSSLKDFRNVNDRSAIQRSKQYALGSLKVYDSDLSPIQNYTKTNPELKKSRGRKLSSENKNIICQKECPYLKNPYSVYEAGDNIPNPLLKPKDKKHLIGNTEVISKDTKGMHILKREKGEEGIFCTCNAPQKILRKHRFIKNKSVCSFCQKEIKEKVDRGQYSTPRLKVRFLDALTISKTNVGDKKKANDQILKSRKITSRKSSNNQIHCCYCGRIVNGEEIKKAAGDHSLKNGTVDRQCKRLTEKIKNIPKRKKNKVSKKQNTIFDMQVDSNDYDILNKEDIVANITKLSGQRLKEKSSNKLDKKCVCRYCKTIGEKLTVSCPEAQNKNVVSGHSVKKKENIINRSKIVSDQKNFFLKNIQSPLFQMQINSDDYDILNKEEVYGNITKFSGQNIADKSTINKLHKKSCQCCICRGMRKEMNAKTSGTKPCICGSIICAEKSKKMSNEEDKLKLELLKNRQWKPCVCGSPVCDHESAIMKSVSLSPDKMTCICQKVRNKEQKKLKEKKITRETKARAIRLEQQRKEDKIRRRRRKKEDKEMEKRINKQSSDTILLAESLIDIGKLGITTCGDILRFVARTTTDPKHAYRSLKAMKEDPQLIARSLKNSFADSGAAGTARRIRLRCMAMRGVKNVKARLERYPITNYLLHIAAKDPKRRVVKKRQERIRERFDFGCSLYMGSLRKRPFLFIYDRLPNFYPHFLALINVYRQFRDLLLFLLAVFVWSPCIVCMEVCRAMMCCLFCTG